MKLAILCLETLTLAFLLAAFIYAVSGGVKNRFLRGLSRVPAFFLPFLAGVFFLGCGWAMRKHGIEPVALFSFALSWTVLFLLGFFLIRKVAIVKKGDTQVCRLWPRWRLIGAMGIVLAFFIISALKVDADARSRLVYAQTRALAQAVRLHPGPVPRDENAALIYEKLAGEIEIPNWAYEIKTPGFIPEAENVRGVLDKHKHIFPLLRRALAMPEASVVPAIGLDREWPGFRAAFPNTKGVHQAAQLLALDAYMKMLNGETRASLESIKAMGTVARQMSRNPHLITTMIASSIIQAQKSSLERVMAFSSGLSPELIPLPVEHKRYLIESWRRSLAMEDAVLHYSFASDFLTGRVQGTWADRSIADIFLLDVLLYRALASGYDLAFFEKFWRKTHEIALKPVYEGFGEQKQWEEEISKTPGGFYAKTAGIPSISRYSAVANMAEAYQGLMELALAAFVYSAEHNRYPAQTGELIPVYLRKVPVDPFDGKSLKMKVVKDGLIFYSIGPDFKDNRGKIEYEPPYNWKKSGDLLFRLGRAYDQAFLKPAMAQLAASGNLGMVKRALAAGADAKQNGPMVVAAAKGHVEVVRLLLQEGADINAMVGMEKQPKRKSKRSRRPAGTDAGSKLGGWSALMAASLNGREQTVKLLLDQGANPNAANNSGRTALMLTSGTAMIEITEQAEKEMKALYRARKNLVVLEARIKALEIEAKGFFKKETVKKQLAQAKAELLRTRRTIQNLENEKAPTNNAVIGTAASSNTIDRGRLVKKLIMAGAKINTQDQTGGSALLAAAFEGNIDAVNVLIEDGADVHMKNRMGWTPLIVATAKGDNALQKVLIDKGASLGETDPGIIGRLGNTLERFKNRAVRKRR